LTSSLYDVFSFGALTVEQHRCRHENQRSLTPDEGLFLTMACHKASADKNLTQSIPLGGVIVFVQYRNRMITSLLLMCYLVLEAF
jgi:hypothetical protein